MMHVILHADGRHEHSGMGSTYSSCLKGANEANRFPKQPRNISKHGFGFFQREVFATAFTSPFFTVSFRFS